MPAEVIGTKVNIAKAEEVVRIMDDYGTEVVLQLPIADVTYRQARINDAVTQQSARETAMDTYAAALTAAGDEVSMKAAADIAQQKAAGLQKKQAAKG